jgi:hypothetical protein
VSFDINNVDPSGYITKEVLNFMDGKEYSSKQNSEQYT